MMNLQELPRLSDSISYIYLEHAIVEREDNAIVAIDKRGRTSIPIAATTCILLGPGTSVTHAAVRAMSENGCLVVWCGERATRFYAAGGGETRSARNLLRQAQACMDETLHLEAARRMYLLRFPEMETKGLSIAQLRGLEGVRVRTAYQQASKRTGVRWTGRSYKESDWDQADPVNQALSEANALLYGLCHSAIVSLGYSPGLGFIHTGTQLAFVYDIADLYKAETTIPAAFEVARSKGTDREKTVRRICRKYFSQHKVLSRLAPDIATILGSDTEEPVNRGERRLWDTDDRSVAGGRNYAQDHDRERT